MDLGFKEWKKPEKILHVIVWSILFFFPFLMSGGEPLRLNFTLTCILPPIIFYAIIFYLNYFILIDKYLFPKRFYLFLLLNIVFIVLAILFNDYLKEITQPFREEHHRLFSFSHKSIWHNSKIVISTLLTIGAAISIKMSKRWFVFEEKQKELKHEQLKSELSSLKYQLQPHFFFNTLNNIYSLVDASPEQSKEALHQLSKMMRYMLYGTDSDLTLLSKELGFIVSYIELMKMRLSGHVKVTYDFPTQYKDVPILHLLFIALVENAFKHGISLKESSFISIKCQVTEKEIEFYVQNSNYPKHEEDRIVSGIGLDNLRKRIELFSASNYTFTNYIDQDIYHARIKVQL